MSALVQVDTTRELQMGREPRAVVAAADEGYMLLGLIVAIALLLLALSVAATNEAFAIRREREVETARRADQYIRAIRTYYKKFGHYPGSVEQLEKSNNIRFLRRKWEDPLTRTTDWRMIAVGQNKTTPKGFFGQPLTGIANTGLGALSGSQSAGMPGPGNPTGAAPGAAGTSLGSPGSGAAAPGGASGTSFGSPLSSGVAPGGTGMSFGTPISGAATPAGTTTPAGGVTTDASAGAVAGAGAGATPGAASGAGGSSSSSPFGSSSGNGLGGTTGAIMGVGTNATGNSILEINEQTTYQNWEFLYDPRVELLKQQQQLNSGLQSTSAGAFGQAPNANAQDTANPAAPNPAVPNGAAPNPGAPNPAAPNPAPAPGGDTPKQP
jgi:type II secretory pathway pseudopilin PulG